VFLWKENLRHGPRGGYSLEADKITVRIRQMYFTALAVSGAAVLLATAALLRPTWRASESAYVPSSPVSPPVEQATPRGDDRLEKLAAQIADLAAKVATLEKAVNADPQVDLLTEINTALQATAKSGAKNAADLTTLERRVSDLRSQTQAGFNEIGRALGNIQLELAKEVERRK
jgi:uncharacterized coiled-coil protein SlyX